MWFWLAPGLTWTEFCYLINKLRTQQYPRGTGFDGAYLIHSTGVSDVLCTVGAQLLVEEQTRLPLDQRYVRCVEVHKIGRESYLKLIICMTMRMSSHLLAAKQLSIDTSFKRAQGWQEFEIESWDINHQRCMSSYSPPQSIRVLMFNLSRRLRPCIHQLTDGQCPPYFFPPNFWDREWWHWDASYVPAYSWLRYRVSSCRQSQRAGSRQAYFCLICFLGS